MSMVGSSEQAASPRVVDDVVCTSCGCLCDDIELEIEGDRIIEARNACPLGRDRFLGYRAGGRSRLPDRRTAGDLRGGDRTGGPDPVRRLDIPSSSGSARPPARPSGPPSRSGTGSAPALMSAISDGAGATMEALQSVGEVTCTLGEIKNRADLIVVWRADPLESHPRLFERYALEPAGTFIPGGRSDRYCVIVDDRETESVREAADQFIAIRAGGELVALWTLRRWRRGCRRCGGRRVRDGASPGDLARVDGSDEGREIRCLVLRQRSGGNPVGSPDGPRNPFVDTRPECDDPIRLPAAGAGGCNVAGPVRSWRGRPVIPARSASLTAIRVTVRANSPRMTFSEAGGGRGADRLGRPGVAARHDARETPLADPSDRPDLRRRSALPGRRCRFSNVRPRASTRRGPFTAWTASLAAADRAGVPIPERRGRPPGDRATREAGRRSGSRRERENVRHGPDPDSFARLVAARGARRHHAGPAQREVARRDRATRGLPRQSPRAARRAVPRLGRSDPTVASISRAT